MSFLGMAKSYRSDVGLKAGRGPRGGALHAALGRADRTRNLGATSVSHSGARPLRYFWMSPAGPEWSRVAGDAISIPKERRHSATGQPAQKKG